MKVYLSSTFKDLQEHRSSVARALAKAGYHVIRMEEYPARAMHTKAACQRDVAECNIYLGIFAWRYGYIPDDDNPERKSITELEYEAAEPAKRLLFLAVRMAGRGLRAYPGAPWTGADQDRSLFRRRLRTHDRSPGGIALQGTREADQ